MKKKKRVDDRILIDLKERKQIKIIRSKKASISDDEINEFKKRLDSLHMTYDSFSELYIKKNTKNVSEVSDEYFHELMQNILKQNALLENMLYSQLKKLNEEQEE